MRDTRSADNIAWIISRNEDRWSKELAGVVASVLRVLVGGNCAPGLAGFNVVLPWPSSLSFPSPFYHRSLIPNRKVTAAPVAFHPHFLLPAPMLPPFSPISTFVVPAWDLSLTHYQLYTHIRRRAFSRVTLNPLPLCSPSFSGYPSESLQSCNTIVTPTRATF